MGALLFGCLLLLGDILLKMNSQTSQGGNISAVILHNIRSAQNVGSILRTAEAAGVGEVVFTGYTPFPIDRFGRERKDIGKVALGAEKSIKLRQEEDIFKAFLFYEKNGTETVAVEQHKSAVDYRTSSQSGRVAFVFGNEVGGLPEAVISACSRAVEIPLYGKKESLNVSVAVGIVLFHELSLRFSLQ